MELGGSEASDLERRGLWWLHHRRGRWKVGGGALVVPFPSLRARFWWLLLSFSPLWSWWFIVRLSPCCLYRRNVFDLYGSLLWTPYLDLMYSPLVRVDDPSVRYDYLNPLEPRSLIILTLSFMNLYLRTFSRGTEVLTPPLVHSFTYPYSTFPYFLKMNNGDLNFKKANCFESPSVEPKEWVGIGRVGASDSSAVQQLGGEVAPLIPPNGKGKMIEKNEIMGKTKIDSLFFTKILSGVEETILI